MNTEVIYSDTYTKLFGVKLLHDYYLQRYFFNGSILENDTSASLALDANYNIWQDLTIVPTKACAQLLRNYHAVMRQSKYGFVVMIWEDGGSQARIPLETDATFDFLVTLKNKFFFNYTDLPLNGLPLINDAGELHRTVYFFSNYEGTALFPYLTDNLDYASVDDRISSKNLPVEHSTTALISIRVTNTLDPAFNLLDVDDLIKSVDFEVVFRARSTRWQYLTQQNSLYGITDPLPLTNSGISPVFINSSLEYLPSAGINMINYNPTTIDIDNPSGTDLRSRIYL